MPPRISWSMSDGEHFPGDPAGLMSEGERAAMQLAVALGEAYRDSGAAGSASPFEGEGLFRRINVQTLTERLRTSVASNDSGEEGSHRRAAREDQSSHVQPNVGSMDHHSNQGTAASVQQVERGPEQYGDIVQTQRTSEIQTPISHQFSSTEAPSEQISLSEVVTQISTSQGHRNIDGYGFHMHSHQEGTRPSQEDVAASMRLAVMLMEAYRDVEDPPIDPFQGHNDETVSVLINVLELINRLRSLAPLVEGDTIDPSNSGIAYRDPASRTTIASYPTTFEGGIRVASSVRAPRLTDQHRYSTAMTPASHEPANMFGTVTMRDPESDHPTDDDLDSNR
ncbi:hypothetical protein FRB97_007667 [Tulasnella sp. 331]|nr:hypothetical protein FRB97_007667 [Tulasnella sp. 331]